MNFERRATMGRKQKKSTPEVADLYRKARSGRLISRMMAGKAWVEIIGPLLEQRKRSAERGSIWRPGQGKAEIGAIALGCARQGGAYDEIDNLLERLARIVKQGEEAGDKLAVMAERKERGKRK